MVRKKITNDEIIDKYNSDYDEYCHGKSVIEIAEERGVSRQTIYKYFRMIAEYYSESLNQKRGRKPEDDLDLIMVLYEGEYESWKQKEVTITKIAKQNNKSRKTIYRYFRLIEEYKKLQLEKHERQKK